MTGSDIFKEANSMTNEEKYIQRDRMRYIKNSLSANLAILGILFDVFFFVSIYKSNVGNYYYNILIGASVVYNLIFMLAAFLSSEGVKAYKKNYSYLLIALGVGQLVRIFIYPMRAHGAVVAAGGVETIVMTDGQFTWVVACLCLSAVCLIASAVTNYVKCGLLAEHVKTLDGKTAA